VGVYVCVCEGLGCVGVCFCVGFEMCLSVVFLMCGCVYVWVF